MPRLPKEAIAAQRKHPVAYACLMLTTLLPMLVGITIVGMFLSWMFPSPGALHIAAGALAFIALVPVFMCLGAYCWLLLARRIVPQSIVKAFFVHRGFGILSWVSDWMFRRVYGNRDGAEERRAQQQNAADRRPPGQP